MKLSEILSIVKENAGSLGASDSSHINEDNLDNDIVLVFRNLINQANSQNQRSYLSWGALNNLMKNIGDVQFDYDSFKQAYDASPMLKNLVHNFDAQGVELKTRAKEPKKAQGDKETDVAKMAKSAVSPDLK